MLNVTLVVKQKAPNRVVSVRQCKRVCARIFDEKLEATNSPAWHPQADGPGKVSLSCQLIDEQMKTGLGGEH